ncbi:hypothetical protein E2C01_072296 [Portunus trituberculatus]|uniref:Uncharacterized protein n=1 Tax=Portunus trituberculatus TaxID=210409 RepID=A0A5B7I7E3_PORTR|nr:hypothetical protein [Portunus trituberculatus]
MRFNRGEVVIYRLKIRCKTTNVAKVNEEKVEGGVKILGRHRKSDLETLLVPSPEGSSEAGFEVAILSFK